MAGYTANGEGVWKGRSRRKPQGQLEERLFKLRREYIFKIGGSTNGGVGVTTNGECACRQLSR